MIILFIRHAESKDGKLTKIGKSQCKLLENMQEDFTFSKIYSSPAERCVETAKALNKNKKLLIELDIRLLERERLKSSPQTNKEQEWYNNYLNPKYSSINPEGCKDLLERVYNFLSEKILYHYQKNENIVIVSHSSIFYAVMSYFNKSQKGNINWYKIGNASKVYFEVL